MQSALVIGEVALAFVLTVGAGLLIQTLARVHGIDAGFRTDHILSVRMAPPGRKYRDPAKQRALCDEIVQRVSALPGVVSAGLSNGVPIAFRVAVRSFNPGGFAAQMPRRA